MKKVIFIFILLFSKVNAEESVIYFDNKEYVPIPIPIPFINLEELNKPSSGDENKFIEYDVDTGIETSYQISIPFIDKKDEIDLPVFLNEEENFFYEPRVFSALKQEDSTKYPSSTAVLVFFELDGLGGGCSGTLIDPRIVLTAGHCLLKDGKWKKNFFVIPGFNGHKTGVEREPFGRAYGKKLIVSKEWADNQNFRYDFGIIVLDNPIADKTGWLGYGYYDDCSFFLNRNNIFHSRGYPAENPFDGNLLYYSFGNIDDCLIAASPGGNAPLFIRNPAFKGMSGSGLYFKDNNNRYIYAVTSAGDSDGTYFSRLSRAFFIKINDEIKGLKDEEPTTPTNPPIADPPNDGNKKDLIKVLAGFGINGTENKRILFRGLKVENIDPSLIVLEHGTGKVMGSNDNWRSHSSANEILKLQSVYQFQHEEDAGMILNLPPGAYDVALGSNNGPGRGIVGINVIDGPFGNSRVINISTNSPKVHSDSKVFAGFVIRGFKPDTKKVLIRAVKVDNNVDPTILVLDSITKKIIRFNDNWRDDPSASSILKLPNRFHLPHEQDAGMILDLQPGTYDVVMDNPGINNNIEGRAIISVNDIDQSNRKTTLINISTNAFIPLQ